MSVPPRPVLGSFTGGQLPLGQSQTPSKQVRPPLQTLPQAPQLLLSQQVATHVPLQIVSPSAQQSPLGHPQMPSKQVSPAGQTLPQAPQWLVVAARIDADTTTVGLTLRAATTRGANATAANTAGTGVLARPAMFWIGGKVAAAVDSAAIRRSRRGSSHARRRRSGTRRERAHSRKSRRTPHSCSGRTGDRRRRRRLGSR